MRPQGVVSGRLYLTDLSLSFVATSLPSAAGHSVVWPLATVKQMHRRHANVTYLPSYLRLPTVKASATCLRM